MFNPDEFLDQQVTEANDTKVTPVPVGSYPAIIASVSARPWVKKEDPTINGVALDVVWTIEDADVKAQLGRDKVTCKQGIMLDTTDEGKLDVSKGANIDLGRLREAVGLNVPGEPFGFNMLIGRSAIVSINHRVSGEDIYSEVKKVAAQ